VSVPDRHIDGFSSVIGTDGSILRIPAIIGSRCARLLAASLCLVGCASSGPSTPSAAPRGALSVSAASAAPVVRELPPLSEASSRNPYAPTCITPLHQYAWQNPQRPPCNRSAALPVQEEIYTTQVRLSFFDSVAAFPLLTDDAPGIVPPKPEADGAPAEVPTAGRRDPDFVVASLRPRLRSCFSSLLERSERAEGSIRFALSVGCAGEVQTISAKAEGVDEPTIECLFAVVAPAMFDPPASGHATIQVPVVFKNSAR
jgi:hypothetical protein